MGGSDRSLWVWLSDVARPVQRWGRTADTVINVIIYLGVPVVVTWLRQLLSADWHWLWAVAALLMVLFGTHSWKQFVTLHPTLDIRIEAASNLNAGLVKSERHGTKFTTVTVPNLRVNPRHSPPPQLDFRLSLPDLVELTFTPMDDLLAEMPDEFRKQMANPKAFEGGPGDYIRDLGFATTELAMDDVPATGLLRFRNLRADRDTWYEMKVPGVFDTRGG